MRALALLWLVGRARPQSSSTPFFVCCFFSADSSCAQCSSYADRLDYCAENVVQCGECGGFWCATEDVIGLGDDGDDGASADDAAAADDDGDVGFCCFYPTCGGCTSRAETGDYCNSLGTCQSCGGDWCQNGGLGSDDPDPTPMPSQEATVPYSQCCVHASTTDACDSCETYVPSTSWCAENVAACSTCTGTWCREPTPVPSLTPEPTSFPTPKPTPDARATPDRSATATHAPSADRRPTWSPSSSRPSPAPSTQSAFAGELPDNDGASGARHVFLRGPGLWLALAAAAAAGLMLMHV